ncbi:hypothetical protein NECAME_02397 [Necator americanus]|uniref:Uncharacterized protein n=1 Tax=Necator americanus TaxID=51031 RepID=W2TE00_NECAM|nr:hypothetical protein NECAME_02397 [Necator americanus]ETN80265.1 hypothetical protein NECAME_02397 [Necator americanus]
MANAGSSTFNPNDARYKACCCHTKTFTIVVGILEIFAICFVLVAVLPDVNSRLCEFTSQNSSEEGKTAVHYGIVLGTGVLGCLIAILIFSTISEENNTAHIIGLAFVVVLMIFWIYSTVTEFWCAHFVKRSQETGFSISVARPIGPATISLSEREAPASPPARQLPPLRHTYGGRRDPQKYAQ